MYHRHVAGSEFLIYLNIDQDPQYRIYCRISDSDHEDHDIQHDQCCRECHDTARLVPVYGRDCACPYRCHEKKNKQYSCDSAVNNGQHQFPYAGILDALILQQDLAGQFAMEIISGKRDESKPCILPAHTFADGVQPDRVKDITGQCNRKGHCKYDQIDRQQHSDCRIPSIPITDRIIVTIFISIIVSVIHKIPPIRPLLQEPLLSQDARCLLHIPRWYGRMRTCRSMQSASSPSLTISAGLCMPLPLSSAHLRRNGNL